MGVAFADISYSPTELFIVALVVYDGELDQTGVFSPFFYPTNSIQKEGFEEPYSLEVFSTFAVKGAFVIDNTPVE